MYVAVPPHDLRMSHRLWFSMTMTTRKSKKFVPAARTQHREPQMSVTASAPIDLSSAVGSQEPLEAVLLITRTGAQLGAWTRNSVPVDVLSVMAATLVGSIETLMTALGAASPREVSLMIDGRRGFRGKGNAQVVLVIVAAGGMTDVALRTAMRQIVKSR